MNNISNKRKKCAVAVLIKTPQNAIEAFSAGKSCMELMQGVHVARQGPIAKFSHAMAAL